MRCRPPGRLRSQPPVGAPSAFGRRAPLTMPFVIDNSVVSGWYLENRATPYTAAVAERLLDDRAWAPAIWERELVDVLRMHAGEVCVCELVPLFELSQPTVSHHLKKLRDAGIVGSVRRGLWAYYYVQPDAMEELRSWLK